MNGEAAELRLLQRCDWRFLLPRPRVEHGICFAGGLLARGVARISDRTADPARPPRAACDLAVAVDPDRATLATAVGALAAGGWCYTEWYSPLAGGVPGVRRRLAAAGLTDVVCYWPWPAPARRRTRLWVPLGAAGARRYFLRTRPTPRRRVARLLRASFRVAWGAAASRGLLAPICAIARKPAPGAAPSSRPRPSTVGAAALGGALGGLIRGRWTSWGFGAAPTHLSWLLLTVSRRLENKVVGLVFAEPDPSLRVIVKMVRVPEAGWRLTQEAAALDALEHLRPGGVPGVPRLLFCEPHGSSPALGQTALHGVRLFTWLGQENARDLVLKTTDWLLGLVRPERTGPSGWWDRLVEPVLADFDRLYGRVIDPGLLRESVARLRTLGELPSAIEHRDFGWWNVLRTTQGELAVLDWETAELDGLPLLDLAYFVFFVGAFLSGASQTPAYREVYRASLDGRTPIGRLTDECVARYLDGAGLDQAVVHPLRLLTWMLQARSDFRDIVEADGQDPPPREALRNGLYFALWEEELRHATKR